MFTSKCVLALMIQRPSGAIIIPTVLTCWSSPTTSAVFALPRLVFQDHPATAASKAT
ncbi:hypothetical protein C366_06882 [Cryptococcus neoformans Tu401-1]|nr:hypothetical protein C365_06932 [Cryptococcus neoformans var. grubii Bt85]OXG09951.1 hypothetical protein C366_06882 [Cryptococcus neoformans var. grubii Tu401-1]OXM75444.1 hypothetical protein C364_06855 [Cryptococcus neoformans var. grubii Bt63]